MIDRGSFTWIVICMGAGIPAAVLRFSGIHFDPTIAAIIYGLAIFGAAFLLSWAAEAAQLDVAASFAIAVLALIAILPEYAIEAVLAWDAGASYNPTTAVVTKEMERVAANVTGANRLLIGLGWSVVILTYWIKRRQSLDIRGTLGLEITMLVIATALAFVIFFMGQIHLILAVGLVLIFLFYLWVTSTRESEEPELIGVSMAIGSLPTRQRRALVLFLFAYSAAVILMAAEPFVESLVETGASLGIDEFILIQWVAPLASESPEIIIAVLFSLRANALAGITILIAAEVNQLTLLIGSMVLIFSASAGEPMNFPLSERQSVEFLLTAAVSLFVILLIAPRIIGWRAGATILVLFVAHLFFVDPDERLIFTYIYLALSVGLVMLDRRRLLALIPGRN